MAELTPPYDIILADPPWFYNNRKTGGERKNKTKFGGGARKHYPLMPDKDLLAMAPFVESLAAENCHLFLWVTDPRLDFGIELLKAWGFAYCTRWITWVKTTKDAAFIFPHLGNGLIYGPGGYKASNPEMVLLGRRGKRIPQTKAMTPSILFAPRQEHSRKPDEVQEQIDLLYPAERKIELFSRRYRHGWTAWGNQAPEYQPTEG